MSTDGATGAAAHVDAAHAGALLAEMHMSGRTIPELPDGLRPGTVAESYAIQDALHEALALPIGALKVGCTSEAAQAALRIDEPIAGRLAANTLHPDGVALDLASFHHPPFLECEFGLRFGVGVAHDDRPPDSEEAAWSLVDAVVPAVELVDSRFAQTFGASPLSLIADNAVAAAAVLGAPVGFDPATPPALAGVAVSLLVDGVEVATGTGADVLGDPIRALQWIVGHEQRRGRSIAAGTVVITGTCTGLVPVTTGAAIVADFGPYGRVSLTVG
ncbi:MAG: 2-keto-4-pentenoate hydratase [Acidimicrobiales bacterium]